MYAPTGAVSKQDELDELDELMQMQLIVSTKEDCQELSQAHQKPSLTGVAQAKCPGVSGTNDWKCRLNKFPRNNTFSEITFLFHLLDL